MTITPTMAMVACVGVSQASLSMRAAIEQKSQFQFNMILTNTRRYFNFYAILFHRYLNSITVMNYSQYPPDFITITCLEWKRVLADDHIKDIIIDSLSFLVKHERIHVYGFVIMHNHFHLIWQMRGDYERPHVQRDFLKYAGQQILQTLKCQRVPIYEELLVNARDRKYQVWERNSLSISLYSFGVFMQKLNYIHNNPVAAGICNSPAEYRYSSAGFYYNSDSAWDFLTHFGG